MSVHPWIDPDDIHPDDAGGPDPRELGMAIIDDDGLLVPLDSDDPEDRELYEAVLRDHPDDCADDCPGLNI